jgi:hypothetical protein
LALVPAACKDSDEEVVGAEDQTEEAIEMVRIHTTTPASVPGHSEDTGPGETLGKHNKS